MRPGAVVELFIGPTSGGPMEAVDAVEAVAGRGLEGDRYFSEDADPDTEVTLIAREAIARALRDFDVEFTARDTRRNIVTQGIPLDDLLDRRFAVGSAVLEGLERNPPCRRLVRITGKPLLKPLIEGGGIRARIVEGGTIRRGDRVQAF